MDLQKIQLILEVIGWNLMQMFAGKQSQLVGVLNDGGNTNGARPIVVEM
jgi:hypothetical protein